MAEITRQNFEAILEGHPRITQALWWDALVSMAIQREWTVNLGQRDALERVAHLLCELFIRLRSAGLTRGHSCTFPLTQAELADATGMSTVHVNRVLQQMRADGLVHTKGTVLTIPDWEALKMVGDFDPIYLHLRPQQAAA